MAKKRRLEEILAQREKTKQNTSNSRNVRQISTGLPTTRQQMVMPRSTTTEVQALAQSLYNRRSDMTAEQQRVASVAQNYTPIKQNGLAPSNEDKNKAIVQKAVANYNPNFRNEKNLSKEAIKYNPEAKQLTTWDKVQQTANKNAQENQDKKWYQKFVQESGALKDGYQVGDLSQATGATALEGVLQVVKPFSDLGTGLANIGATGVAQVADWIGKDEFANRLRKAIGANESVVDTGIKLANQDSVLGDTTDTILNAFGQYGLNAIGGQALGKAGQMKILGVNAPTLSVISSFGQGLKKGYSDEDYKNWQVYLKASGDAVIEGMTEGLNDVLGVGGSTLSDMLKGNAMKPFKSGLAKALARTGLSSAEEGLEEVLSYLGSLGLDNLIGYLEVSLNQGDGEKWKREFNKDEFWENFWVGTISALATEAPNTAITHNAITQKAIQDKTNELSRELTQNEKQQISKDAILNYETNIQKDYTKGNKITNQIKNSGLTENQQQKLTEVAQKYDLSQADIQNLIDNTKNGKYEQKQATTMENKAISNQSQQVIQQEGKIDKKAISQEVEQELKNTNYKREESVKRAFESAKKYNIDTKSDTFREKIRIADERGVDLVYDASVFGNNTNQNAVWKIKRDENGKIVSREIVFNPNAKGDMTLEQVWTHEITHDMEGNGKYKTMRNELLEYLQAKPEYEKAFNDLKAIYSKVYAEENLTEQEFNELIEDEVVADMLGSKLGDTEFLKSLNKEKRSLGKRIYDWVVDRLNRLNKKKGYTNEKLFWQDIKNKFENAYKEDFVDVEKNQDTMYNVDESEGVLNGKQRRNSAIGMQKSNVGSEKENIFTANRYKQEETNIRKRGEVKYTQKDREFSNKLKEKYNKKAFIFDDSDVSFGGGVSLLDKDTIYFGRNAIQNYGYDFLEGHEILEDINSNHKKESKKIIEELKEKLQQDDAFGDVFLTYIADMDKDIYEYYIDRPQEVAKEIIADLNGLRKQGIDYKTLESFKGLKEELVKEIQQKVEELENKIYKNKNSNKGSFLNGKFSVDTNKKSLLAVHNLSADKLKGVLELGGFPVPSIAVTNPNKVNHESYGAISVIFNKNAIDPADERNEVYDRDVWSPTFPTVEYEINDDAISKIRKIVGGYQNSYQNGANSTLNNLEDRINRIGVEKTLEELKKDTDFKYVYAKTLNDTLEPIFKDVEENIHRDFSNETIKEFIKEYGKVPKWTEISSEDRNILIENFKNKVVPELEKRVEEKRKKLYEENPNPPMFKLRILESSVENAINKLDALGYQDDLIEAMNKIQEGTTTVRHFDKVATDMLVNEIIKDANYEEWIDTTFKDIILSKGIYNDKEYLKPDGTRRTFKQLHDKYNLSNIVKYMTAKATKSGQVGFGSGSSFGSISAQKANRFNSIEDIKNAENRLTSEEKELIKPYEELIYADMKELAKYIKHKSDYVLDSEIVGPALNDLASKEKLTDSVIKKVFDENNIDYKKVPKALINKITDDLESLRNVPTDYFEAKPQRAVGFEEIASMVIPNNLDANLKKQLQDRGIKTIEYDPNVEGDRNAKMTSAELEEYKFSLSQETKANLEAKIDRYSKLVEEMQQDGRDAEDWAPYANEILRLQDQLEGNKYSRESTGAWNEFKNKYAKNEGEGNRLQDIKLEQPKKVSEVLKPKKKISEVFKPKQTTVEVEEKQYTPSKKAQDYEKRQKNSFKKKMSDLLGVSRYNRNNKAVFNDAIEELQKDFNNNSSKISEKKKNEVFENMYQKLVKEDTAFYNDNKEIKDIIRLTPLYVSDKTKADITDYNDFKRNAFGSVKLSNDKSNVPVDTFYKELTYMNPELFPDTITSTGDQLRRIVEVAKSIRKSERNISAYNDETMSKEYKRWAKYEFDKIVAELEGEFRNIQKYNAEKEKEFISKNEPYVKPEVAEIKFIYENRAQLRKDIEKQEKILLLTQREKAVVDRLLKDEMDIEEIQDGLNKNGIIKSYYARQQLTYLDEAVKQYKQYKKQQLKESSDVLTENAKEWSDKKLGIQYSRETATRNIRDIMSKEDAERVNKEIFEPILHNTSEQTRFINNYVDIIENLDLDKKEKYEWHDADGKEIKIDEATLAQLVIEKKIDNDYLKEVGADVEKINKVAKTFSKILEETVNKMDEIYIEFGYAPVEKRKNYFPHFIENKADTFMSKFANALGIRVNPDNLPTDIAGRTETFKPGRAFDRNILRRTTDKTDYNALKALDMYIQGASDIIYHTEDIQKLRAFNESIRDKFRDSEIDKKIEEINENPELTVEERAEKIKEIKENVKTPLGNLVTWLDEYTNALANKKSSADRQLEKDLNRQIYTTMQDLEGRIASNLIGGNLSVSLTNFSPLAQAMGTTKIGDILIGMIQTTQNTIKDMQNNGDNFVSESDFLTSRRGTGQAQKQTAKQNVSNFLGIPMEFVDNFTSESIVRAKYRENIKKGMEHAEALYKADTYARNLMGDRSKGALPTLFNRKNPVAKLMTSFQVEPNNIISNYFKDMPADAETKSQLAGNIVKLSVASWAFNTILKSIRGGSDVIPNPIGIISKLVGLAIANLDDDEENDKDVQEVLIEIAGDVLGSIPFGTSIATIATALGVEGLEDTGKFMVSNALPSASKVKNLFDKDVAPEYKKKIALEELTKPLIYLGLPTAGAQVAKTAKGISAYIQGGSYTYDTKGNKKMQFPIEQNAGNAIKAGLFGKYSLEGGKTYVESEFKSLNGEETKVYEESNVDFYKLQEYFNYSKQEGIKKEDKINYVSSMNISDSDKWNLYKHNILSSTERDDGTSQLTDAEYIIKNNMATEKEYMKLYSDAVKNKVEFPSTETLKELKQEKLSLKTYLDYKTEAKKETIAKRRRKQDENASLTDAEQCQILIDSNYTDKEKKAIYSNYIAKNDKTYLYLEKLTGNKVNINQYLDYKTAEIKGIDDPKSIVKGKTKSGSKKANLQKYLRESNFSEVEALYIYGTQNSLNSTQRVQITNYINKAKQAGRLTASEEKELYKKLKSVEELENGQIRWK